MPIPLARLVGGAAAAALILVTAVPALGFSARPPTRVGQCTDTKIAELTSRLEGVPDSGDAIVYANGVYGVSYDKVSGLRGARVGDRVRLCLTFIPSDCPAGDTRGRRYEATDLRTKRTWELPDAEHMCGGA